MYNNTISGNKFKIYKGLGQTEHLRFISIMYYKIVRILCCIIKRIKGLKAIAIKTENCHGIGGFEG